MNSNEKTSPQLPYIRIYFDRASSLCVVDTGIGTTPFRATTVFIHGYCYTEYARTQDDSIRPRFWIAMRDVVLILNTESGVLHVESKVEQWQRDNTNINVPHQNVVQYSNTAHHQGH